jgi:hypothetical protein
VAYNNTKCQFYSYNLPPMVMHHSAEVSIRLKDKKTIHNIDDGAIGN